MLIEKHEKDNILVRIPGLTLRLAADLATWQVHAPQAEDVLGAIDLQGRYQTSFWGAMILQSAGQLGAKVVLSEDLNPDQDYAGLQVANPLVVS
jgi:predicted nucleic acid-binding protein